MRQIWTPRTQIKRAGRLSDGIHRGTLAEDYDGIGQYVLVALAGSSVSSAYKARVAAGDFGGRRVIPRGSRVVVHSNRGNLEVFLGNRPRPCDQTCLLEYFENDFPDDEWGPGVGFDWDWNQAGPGGATYQVFGFPQPDGGNGQVAQLDLSLGGNSNDHGDTYQNTDDLPDAWSRDFELSTAFIASILPHADLGDNRASWAIGMSEDNPASSLTQCLFFRVQDSTLGGQDSVRLLIPGVDPDKISWPVPQSSTTKILWKKIGSRHYVKLWYFDDPEPTSWTFDGIIQTDPGPTLQSLFVYSDQPHTRVFSTDPNASLMTTWFRILVCNCVRLSPNVFTWP